MTLLSPGIEAKETSLQTTVVNNATGRAAIVGKFNWGPAYQITQVTNEVDLVDKFGTPDDETADYFMSAANFLQYGNDLRVVRVVNEDRAKNASPLAGLMSLTITNPGANYEVGDQVRVKYLNNVIESTGTVTQVNSRGEIQKVFIPTAKIISYAKTIDNYPALSDSWSIEVVSKVSGVGAIITQNGITVDSKMLLTVPELSKQRLEGTQFIDEIAKHNIPAVVALYPGELGNTLEVEIISYEGFKEKAKVVNVFPTNEQRTLAGRSAFQFGPQTKDQYGIIVRKSGQIVESYVLSTKRGDRDVYGSNIYLDDFFSNGSSSYIFMTAKNWPKGFNGIIKLSGGVSANNAVTAGDMMKGWDYFSDPETTFVNLFIAGACAGEGAEFASTVQKHAQSIADERRDGVTFTSPPSELIVNVPVIKAVENLVNWRQATGAYDVNNMNVSSTHMFIDANYKFQYDKYNDVNRWVPLAADIAGLCARTDFIAQPWMSPAGYNRGQILNCIKLAIEPRQSQRDMLYQVGLNPVIPGMGGEGFILFGDKTATSIPTPFDRINVRRLFNMLKRNISNSSKYRLFENNTSFTRSSFRMETSQYIGGIKSLGGVYDYRVVCDTTNNTPAVIDRGEFVATFYIKPARSINYIILNFVATSTGANFEELIGGSE